MLSRLCLLFLDCLNWIPHDVLWVMRQTTSAPLVSVLSSLAIYITQLQVLINSTAYTLAKGRAASTLVSTTSIICWSYNFVPSELRRVRTDLKNFTTNSETAYLVEVGDTNINFEGLTFEEITFPTKSKDKLLVPNRPSSLDHSWLMPVFACRQNVTWGTTWIQSNNNPNISEGGLPLKRPHNGSPTGSPANSPRGAPTSGPQQSTSSGSNVSMMQQQDGQSNCNMGS